MDRKIKAFILLLTLSFVVNVFPTYMVFAEEEIVNVKFIPGEVLVSLYGSPSTYTDLSAEDNVFGGIDVNKVESLASYTTNDYTESSKSSIVIVKLTLNSQDEQDVLNAVEQLSNNPNVSAVQPNYIINVEETIPNDEFYEDLWSMDNIDAYDAWDRFTGDKGIVVGIIDTGIDYTHPDLVDNLWNNPNAAEGTDVHGWNFAENNADIMDYNGHGTHVAGIIGAAGNNLVGVTGVNWNISLASLKVFKKSGFNGVDKIIQAIDYADNHDIKILNCSVGWSNEDNNNSILRDFIDSYEGLFICSAGNDKIDNDHSEKKHYPSEFSKTTENIISVGATNELDECEYSYGTESVQLGAPGVGIWSTASRYYDNKVFPTEQQIYKYGSDNSRYAMMSGSSMAAPLVTGAVALIMGYKPELTPIEVKNIILQNVDKIPQLEDKFVTGGKLNIKNIFDTIGSGNIHASIHEVSYNGVFEIGSINLSADGIYKGNDVYITVNRYNVSNDLVYSESNKIQIDEEGKGKYTDLSQDALLRSSSEHLEVLIYEDKEYNKMISKQLIYPVLFTF